MDYGGAWRERSRTSFAALAAYQLVDLGGTCLEHIDIGLGERTHVVPVTSSESAPDVIQRYTPGKKLRFRTSHGLLSIILRIVIFFAGFYPATVEQDLNGLDADFRRRGIAGLPASVLMPTLNECRR